MNRNRRLVVVAAVTLLISIPGVTSAQADAAGEVAPTSACGLLADPQVQRLISGPGAAALGRQCERERLGLPYVLDYVLDLEKRRRCIVLGRDDKILPGLLMAR